jgi:probable F420-dependent oxidoreductase
MRFSMRLPSPADALDHGPDALLDIARAVERAGLHACYVTDHPFPALHEGGPAHHAFDPFNTLTFLASATSTLLLHVNSLVLGYRNPFLAASAVATLDHLSHGRLILGVATGWLKEEFAALGVEFSDRNALAEEALTAMKLAWSGEPVTAQGRHWQAERNSMLPRPVTTPHPPIWMAGNSLIAMQRAARYCQGWSPVENTKLWASESRTANIASVDDLTTRIARLQELMEATGRTEPLDICFVRRADWLQVPNERILEELALLESVGVKWVTIRFAARSNAEVIERIQAFGELVSARDDARLVAG